MPHFMTAGQAAKAAGLSYNTMLSLSKREDAPVIYVGNSPRFNTGMFYEWLDALTKEKAAI